MDIKAGLDALVKRQISCSTGNRELFFRCQSVV